MKKLSLRMRLTLITIALITAIAVILALLSMYNAGYFFASAAQSFTIDDVSDTVEASIAMDELMSAYDSGFMVAGMTSGDGEYFVPASVGTSITIAANQFNEINLLYTIIVIAAGGIATWFVLGRALKPVKALSEEIAGISENELDVRITEFQAGDEINSLADSFNLMLSRLEHAFENQKSFSTAAAHELKTPLATIKARLDVTELSGAPTKKEYTKTMEVVRNQTERMIGIVDDLFLFSTTNGYEYADDVDLEALMQGILVHLGGQIKEKNLSVAISGGTHRMPANRSMLERAFTNIIENAVKYNHDGGKLEICVEAQGRDYRVSVKDTGVGIPEDQREQIFEPFFRVDKSRSRKIAGAGLGLAIAKKMIGKHGGTIAVTSNEEGGSTFTVTLHPRADAL